MIDFVSLLGLVALILIATYFVSRALTSLADVLSTRVKRYRVPLLQLIALIRISLWLLSGYVIVAGVFEPSPEASLIFFGLVGIGVVVAAQDALKNVFAGILLLIDRPFAMGDLVDTGEHRGEVVGIGLRATRMLLYDDSVVAVPNAAIVSRPVRNISCGAPQSMVVTELFVPGLADPTLVQKLSHEAVASSPYLYAGKPIRIRVADEFRDTFVTRISIEAYVYDHRLETAFATDVAQRAKRAFLSARLLSPETVPAIDGSETAKSLASQRPDAARLPMTDRVEAS